jgi:hypothetical protein
MCALLASALLSANLLSAAEDTEIEQLKAALAAQQKQIQALQQAMDQEQKMLERALQTRPNLGTVASLSPMVPSPAPVPAPLAIPAPTLPSPKPQAPSGGASGNPCEAPPDANAVPAYLRLGSVCVIPVGFMDLTSIWRDKNAGSGIGTNFGNIPYNNTVQGKLSEFRFSPQNSRLGFRADGDWKGTHFMAYNEFDFLGTSGTNNLGVTNGAFVPRIRLFWIDVRKDKWEFLGGQSWSLLTPNRRGESALPGDIFFSQTIDVNYMAGLTWSRQPGVRVLYHANNKVVVGLSAENPDQYIGGSGGTSAVTLPKGALGNIGGVQVDNTSSSVLGTPNLHPDLILKLAIDPSPKFHFEVAGIERTFKIFNQNNSSYSTKVGGGLQFGLNAEVVKNFRIMTTNFWSDGGGRYLFGEAPDFIVRADGTISPEKGYGTVDGFEWALGNTLLYAYYGGIYIGRDTAIDLDGTLIGYGYRGGPNSQNRSINEITFGFNQTMWRNPRYGAINIMGQYQYTMRDPWFVAVGAPKATHDNAIYMNLRYTLPGSMPNF